MTGWSVVIIYFTFSPEVRAGPFHTLTRSGVWEEPDDQKKFVRTLPREGSGTPEVSKLLVENSVENVRL